VNCGALSCHGLLELKGALLSVGLLTLPGTLLWHGLLYGCGALFCHGLLNGEWRARGNWVAGERGRAVSTRVC